MSSEAASGAGPQEHLTLTTGRRSTPLGFTEDDRGVYLVAKDRTAQWPIFALREGKVSLTRHGSRTASGGVTLISDREDRERILTLFRAKYGEAQFERWYSRPARVLRVDVATTSPTGTVVADGQYQRWLVAEFDGIAHEYDRHILGNRMNVLLRDRSLALMRPLFRSNHLLMEVGCGSGTETMTLLADGHELIAVDISAQMLEVVREKARSQGCSEQLRTFHLAAREVGALEKELGIESLDGAYSTYGALNCEADLRPFRDGLARLLRPEAPFVAGVFNRWCLFELVGYGLTARWTRALGRRTNPIPVGFTRFFIDTWAYSVVEFADLFAPGFHVERVEGVPVFLPPSDLTSYAEKFSRRFGLLEHADAWAGRRFPFNQLGDHFLMVLRRSEGPLPGISPS